MKIPNSPVSAFLGAAFFAASATPLLPQTAPARPTAAQDEDVVTLSEFNVSAATVTNDYVAAESITGTRVASKLVDLPFNVNVVTGEFIEDFAAFEVKDQFAYVSSFSPNETQGDYQLRGFEADFNLQATESLQFIGGYGYADAITSSNDEFRFLVNTTPRRVPQHTVGLASRYEIKQGPWQGLSFTGGFNYYSESVVNAGSGRTLTASASNPIVNNRMPNGLLPFAQFAEGAVITTGTVRVGDGREAIMNAAYEIFEAGISYRWRDNRRRSHRAQLNAKNLFDRRYTWGSAAQGDPVTLIGTYSITF